MAEAFSNLLALAVPALLLGLWLLLRRRTRVQARPSRSERADVIIDGSNVMHWQAGAVSLDPVKQVVTMIAAQGLRAGVVFDANAGYKTHARYQDDAEMARHLGLPEDRVLVVPKGVPADRFILLAARSHKARVVTNDRYRDWAEEFPEVAAPGFLIRGGVRQGALWLNDRDLASTPASP